MFSVGERWRRRDACQCSRGVFISEVGLGALFRTVFLTNKGTRLTRTLPSKHRQTHCGPYTRLTAWNDASSARSWKLTLEYQQSPILYRIGHLSHHGRATSSVRGFLFHTLSRATCDRKRQVQLKHITATGLSTFDHSFYDPFELRLTKNLESSRWRNLKSVLLVPMA